MKAVKLVLRTCLRFVRDLDGLFTWLTQRLSKQHYRVEGSCKKRGICCQNIAIGLSPKLRPLKSWVIGYYEFVYNFIFITELPREQVLLFRCRYLKNNQCSIHWKRPYICRHYPNGRFFRPPGILPGCGYRYSFARSANDKS